MNTQLVRSNNDKMLAGVCGGLARSLGVDSTIVRIIFLLAIFAGGASPLIYIVLWIVMPQEATAMPGTPPPAQLPDPTGEWQYDPYTGERMQK